MSSTPFVTPAALVAEFGAREIIDLTDRADPRTHAVDEAVAQRACDRAIADINGALRGRYRLPLSSVPELLPFLALDLAHFYLYEGEPPTVVQTRFDEAKKTLRAIQSGAQPLGIDAAGSDVADTPIDLPEFHTGDKQFGRGNW